MSEVVVDSNVILDVMTEGSTWFEWSASALEEHAESSVLLINPIIYSEVSVRFTRIEDLDDALPASFFRRAPLPWEAGFLAGKCHLRYRRQGGSRTSPLPDFYIGAHAAVRGAKLLTRDASVYRAYFPQLDIIAPDTGTAS